MLTRMRPSSQSRYQVASETAGPSGRLEAMTQGLAARRNSRTSGGNGDFGMELQVLLNWTAARFQARPPGLFGAPPAGRSRPALPVDTESTLGRHRRPVGHPARHALPARNPHPHPTTGPPGAHPAAGSPELRMVLQVVVLPSGVRDVQQVD